MESPKQILLLGYLGPPELSSTPPEIMDVTKSSVALAWSRPKDDGGSAITGYYVEYKETTVETWSRHQAKITSTMFTLHGLTPDTSYQFRIVAVNDIGESEAGVESDVVTCKDPFGESHFTKISSCDLHPNTYIPIYGTGTDLQLNFT